jgi:glycosyltransferase involved in cell wall biosynthesis
MLGRRLAAMAQALRLDVLEAPEFGGLSAFLAKKGARPFRVVVRLHTCSWLVKSTNNSHAISPRRIARELLVSRIEKHAIENADAVTSISKRTTEETRRVHSLKRDDIVSIPNPVPAPFFDPTQGEASRNGRNPVVLYVGRLEWRKGPDLVVRAFAEVSRYCPQAKLRLVGGDTSTAPGGGSMLRYLRSLASDLVRSRVEFLGERSPEDLPQFYRDAKVCVFPSRWEGFGIVCAEAMAAGKPVIVPRNSGFAEHITQLNNGVLIPENDPGSLAEAVAGVLSNPALAARMGAAAKQYALEHFRESAVVGATLRVYESALDGNGQGSRA